MIDKLAGLPTQIRQLEKRLKEMDASKVKPALVKEITDTIKNLKDMLKEKQEKSELRKKNKMEKVQEVEAAPLGAAPAIGATAPNAVPATMPGQPEATPTTPDDQKISCPLCGGMTFNDQAAYQQHMEFTHASDIMPTNPGQKLDKTVAAVDPVINKVETDPKIAPGIIVPDSVKKHDEIVDKVENDPKVAPHLISEQGPQFKLDDAVKPIRGGESKGKVMRWDGKPNDLVYVMWESGPLADRDTFGGYYPHDLQAVAQEPVEAVAAPVMEEPVCEKCVAMQQKHGDLKTNYEGLLKDLQEERDIHYTQGNSSWVARLEQKITDLKKSMEDKFPTDFNGANEKQAAGGPRLIRQIHRATSGHGYEATEYDLANGHFKQNVPLKINDTGVRMTDPTRSQFEVKYDGMDWRLVAPQEFEQWLGQWKEVNQANTVKEGAAEYPTDPKWGQDHETSPWTCSCGAQIKSKNEGLAHFRAHHGKGKTAGAQNAEELTIMDHTPPQANSGPDAGGKDSHDEFQDEWAMPVTSATKLNVFKRELLATPSKEGYDISHEGKKLFNIKGKENKPMNKKQLEFCAQIEFTRGMKQAKLVEKIASLEAGSTVFIMAHDKTSRRVKFASLEHGFRGWAPASKFAYLNKKADPMRHGDHVDDVVGSSKSAYLTECPQGSGNMRWIQGSELLPTTQPPATPESLNDLESSKNVKANFPSTYFARPESKQRADQFGLIDIEDADLTPEGLAAKKQEMIEGHDIEGAKGSEDKLLKQFEAKYPEYNGWTFEYMYPGSYSYSKDNAVVFFTPDWDADGEVNIQITDADSNYLDGNDIPYKAPLTADSLFAIVKPYLDRQGFEKQSLQTALPKAIVPQRGDVNTTQPMDMPSDEEIKQKALELFKQDFNALNPAEQNAVYQALGKTASLNKVARVVHREDGWHVLSEKGKNLGGPYKSKGEAVKRLRQVEYFKHHGAIRPFSRSVIADVLTDHINDMKGRITEVQDRLQNVPAVKTSSSSEEVTQEQALPNHYIVQFVQVYDTFGPDAFCFLKATYDLAQQLEDNGFILDIDGPSASGDQVANAENMDHGDVNEELAYRLERKWPVFLAKVSKFPDPLTPEMREQLQGEIAVGHEDELKQELAKAQQNVDQLKQQLGDLGVSARVKVLLEKKALKKNADQVTDETITTNDPNAIIDPTNPLSPDQAVAPAPTIQNVQPTDDDNLNVPVAAPTSPTPPGTKWTFDTQFNKYVIMPDPAAPGKTI